PNQPFEGVVRSVGWGVYVQDGLGTGTHLLPSISQTVDWVRLPQRFAVRIQVVGSPPVPFRIGQTVYVTMKPMVERTDAPQTQTSTVEHELTKRVNSPTANGGSQSRLKSKPSPRMPRPKPATRQTIWAWRGPLQKNSIRKRVVDGS